MRSLALAILLVAACRSHDPPAAKRSPATPSAPPAPPAQGPPRAPSPPRPAIDASHFDRTCAAATDCVLVKAALCDPCGCAADAIASSAMAAFDEAGYKLACPPPELDVKCTPCPSLVAACESGRCVAKPH